MKNYLLTIEKENIPQQISDICDQGWNYYNHEKYEAAIIRFNSIISKYPNYLKALWRRHEAYRALGCKLNDDDYIKKAIDDINICLISGPKNSSLYIEKAYLYSNMNDTHNAIKFYNKAIKIEPFDSEIYYSIALEYSKKNNFLKALHNFDLAMQYLPHKKEFSIIIESVNKANPLEMGTKMKNLLENTPLPIGKQLLSEFEMLGAFEGTNNSSNTFNILTDEVRIHLERGELFQKNGYYNKALNEFSNAIQKDIYWPESYLKRAKLFQILGIKYNKKWLLLRAESDLIQYGKISLQDFSSGENKYKLLYNALKSTNKKAICDMLNLFKDMPQTIVNIITDYSYPNLILNDYQNAFNTIEDFTILLHYLDNSLLADHQKLGIKAILYYYLGGLTYSFIIFDELLDLEKSDSELTSQEMYYYSKATFEIEIDPIIITSYNIKKLEHRNKTIIDYYYLGQLYYLLGDINNAIANFKHAKSFIYSNIMLSYLTKNEYYIKNIRFNKLLSHKIEINYKNDILSQFYNYFYFTECTCAIEYWIYDRHPQNIDFLHKNIWEIFKLPKESKKFILQEIRTNEIIKNIQIRYIEGNDHSIYNKDVVTQTILINEFQYSIRDIDGSLNKEITIASRIFKNGTNNIDLHISIISYYYNKDMLSLKEASTLFLYISHITRMENTKRKKEITQNIVLLCLRIMFTNLALILDTINNVVQIIQKTTDSKNSNPYLKFDYIDFKEMIWKKIAENNSFDSIMKQII